MNWKRQQEIKVICMYENVAALLFILSEEKNFEQREMMIEDNAKEQRW